MNKKTDVEKKFTSVAESQINKTEKLLSDNTYIDSEEKLKQNQQKASLTEDLKKQEIEDRKSNRKLREKYANKIFWYMCIWSTFIIIVIMLSGFLRSGSFYLDRWVLITLLGNTTVNMFAIIHAIIKGIFKER